MAIKKRSERNPSNVKRYLLLRDDLFGGCMSRLGTERENGIGQESYQHAQLGTAVLAHRKPSTHPPDSSGTPSSLAMLFGGELAGVGRLCQVAQEGTISSWESPQCCMLGGRVSVFAERSCSPRQSRSRLRRWVGLILTRLRPSACNPPVQRMEGRSCIRVEMIEGCVLQRRCVICNKVLLSRNPEAAEYHIRSREHIAMAAAQQAPAPSSRSISDRDGAGAMNHWFSRCTQNSMKRRQRRRSCGSARRDCQLRCAC